MIGRTRIKICGIRDVESADAAASAGADAIGLMFIKESPRYIDPEAAFTLAALLPPFVTTVGVYQDLSVDQFAELEQQCPTGCAQLHGSESVDTARRCGPGVIKAITFDEATIADLLCKWDDVDEVEAILVDGSAGGLGEAFDWAALRPHIERTATPIIVAGGLNPDNVGNAITQARPWGVDVSSGVEREKGVKDPALIAAFCDAVHRADAEAN